MTKGLVFMHVGIDVGATALHVVAVNDNTNLLDAFVRAPTTSPPWASGSPARPRSRSTRRRLMGLFRLRLDFLPFLVQRRVRLVDDQPVTGDQSLTVARMRQLADEFEVGESEFLDSRETRRTQPRPRGFAPAIPARYWSRQGTERPLFLVECPAQGRYTANYRSVFLWMEGKRWRL